MILSNLLTVPQNVLIKPGPSTGSLFLIEVWFDRFNQRPRALGAPSRPAGGLIQTQECGPDAFFPLHFFSLHLFPIASAYVDLVRRSAADQWAGRGGHCPLCLGKQRSETLASTVAVSCAICCRESPKKAH